MIQVIERAFSALEIIRRQGRASLSNITGKTGLKKTTLHTILKTMVALGYLEQDENGCYRFAKRMYALTDRPRDEEFLEDICAGPVCALADELGEAVVAAILVNDERRVLIHRRCDQLVAINPDVFREATLYDSVTGRVLLAFAPDATCERIVAARGLPHENEWQDVRDPAALAAALAEIRTTGSAVSFKADPNQPDIPALGAMAVPVLDNSGKLIMAVGAYMPATRFEGRHKEDTRRGLQRLAGQVNRDYEARHKFRPYGSMDSDETAQYR